MPQTASYLAAHGRFRILLVDDDPVIRHLYARILEEGGFEVWPTSSGPEALRLLEQKGLPHLAVIDIKMPGMSGIELGRKLQGLADLPVIMVTSVDDIGIVVETIDTVAEDYIRKPVEPAELVARVRRVLRRIGDFSYALEPRIKIDDRLEVEFARRLAFVEGRPVELTPTENKLLYLLMRSAGRTLLTDYLLRRLWPDEEAFEDSLRNHVWRLRKKIEETPRRPRYVITKRGLGYRFLDAHERDAGY